MRTLSEVIVFNGQRPTEASIGHCASGLQIAAF
jgi:hypothetical protein